ncbi:MAG: leucyl/phenylalanyl-tRNA--protein transferase [Sphingomonadaceae bacterium]|nr:leucyl/phenylalanyl-tRNA--protein transferase [Sphingomonadaceae bacterium]
MLYQLSYTPAGALAIRSGKRGWQGTCPAPAAICYGEQMHAPVPQPIIEPDLLLLAYRSGIFPMADARDDPEIFWVEPRRRAILPLDSLRCSRSLARTLRRGRFTVTCNADFVGVMQACAGPRGESGETWISHRIEASYLALYELGYAHSIECWQDTELVGGLYGVGFDRVFCGESMFSRVPDASKVALAWLVAALRRGGGELLDCQFMTDHLASLGAIEISQTQYLRRLKSAQRSTEGVAVLGAGALGAGEGAAVGAGEAVAAGLALPAAFGALLADAALAGLSSSPGNFIAQSLTQTS